MSDPAHALSSRFTVSPRVAVLSIIGFWAFYFASVTLRAWIMDYSGHLDMLDNRAWVSLFGVGFTYLLYRALRPLEQRSLRIRVAAAFLFSIVAATAYSSVNYLSFYVYDPTPHEPAPGPPTAKAEVVKKIEKGPGHMIAENAIHWYFFITSWAVLYLALSYAGAVRASEREGARLRAAAQTAELRALRYQVNPHFLFNALNSISSLVMSGRHADAEAMILNLSTFFRTSLAAEPTEDVPLADEIALQRLYLEIEAVRYPQRLRSVFDIAPEAERACIPGLLLQPLVENAIKHGVAPARRPVEVLVRAWIDGLQLVIEVIDDGDAAQETKGTCVGLRNVRDRLNVRFGDAASLAAGPRAQGGFAAKIRIPVVAHGC
ncbi:histidine kinase [Sphingomonas sp. R647]|uniref:sensor histidine kinase n=1 Tax=Sphingomonas sp. R647 TaxID=2875233 RepID=UPI001CD7BA53|nr:histidine kinase [Sphingomonas sp. R647]MCA1197399.1 histidine kinase [Sphingomonas sp. R647]